RPGKFRVLFTTQSKSLRAHPGQTVLPGGKVDDRDESLVWMALREANEEVGLPLQPFLSPSQLLVTPVILSSPSSNPILRSLTPSPTEVNCIFGHPLEVMPDPQLILDNGEPLVDEEEDCPYGANTRDVRFDALGGLIHSMHRFRTRTSSIKGLPADILISVVKLAYERNLVYGRHPSNPED
ncbi:hypothetical protein K503DRAFT_664810, partial [Rhizopogon vinicolor AM-OR11-026]